MVTVIVGVWYVVVGAWAEGWLADGNGELH